MKERYNIAIHIFTNDLRLEDNEAFAFACNHADTVLPVYMPPAHWNDQHALGFPRVGTARKNWLEETLYDLQQNLIERGSNLLRMDTCDVETLRIWVQDYGISLITIADSFAQEEKDLIDSLRSLPAKVMTFETSCLLSVEDLPFAVQDLPLVFTTFRKQVEKNWTVRAPLHVPAIPPLPAIPALHFPVPGLKEETQERHPFSAFPFQGGERHALIHLRQYIFERKLIATYKETRNGLLGTEYSSKFSPWLATGAISARTIYAQVRRFEEAEGANASTYWLIFELLWRDYFKWLTARFGSRIFHASGLKEDANVTNNNPALFRKWMEGTTGQYFIDANMRELQQTGFMSNRGRQNAASYLVHDLQQDWRWGAAWFESRLIDYDVCSNYGNWLYVAGLGTDPRSDRYFNPEVQANRYDSDGAFRKLWLSEHSSTASVKS